MIRNCSLSDISDGKLYSDNDMVKTECNDCEGCHACCQGMGGSIVLDPYDCYQLTTKLSKTLEQLLAESVSLNVVDQMILPNLKMQEGSDHCAYLDQNGRCSIHAYRPGICRLFPLGRYWDEQGKFHYILQTGECQKEQRTKVKVKKWLGIENLSAYNTFVKDWHDYLGYARSEIAAIEQKQYDLNQRGDHSFDEDAQKQIRSISMYTLNTFFVAPYAPDRDFYSQYQERMEHTKKILSM